ncbi:MAG: hypothetical protein PHC68_04200 [Syntrophorhabdaceae bacterium]|nr:hypothetical protein [Syntrophorhabdaceae bacterium]
MSDEKDLGNYDGFGDIVSGHQGIFDGLGGQALKTHDSVHSEVTKDGLVLEFYCHGCGKPRQLVVEYPELIALRYGVNPAVAFRGQTRILATPINWRFVSEENAWKPDMTCDGCAFHLFVRIAPSEPQKYLEAARQKGLLAPQYEQQLSQIASQAAQLARAGR